MESAGWLTLKITHFDLEGHWGFCEGEESKVFFHVRNFHKLKTSGPPPVLGEQVSAFVQKGTRGLFATGLRRLNPPLLIEGRVRSFDSKKGWGFIAYGDKVAFLHKSDLMVNLLPTIGQKVVFFLGESKNKPRACWPRFEVEVD